MFLATRVAFGLALGVLHSAGFSIASGSGTRHHESLKFTTCTPETSLTSDFECGYLKVPVNYDNLEDGTIDIWVSRHRATSHAKQAGTLFFNPGGPGGAASAVFSQMVTGFPAFSQTLLENYDIIGVDTRGIGYSNPLRCDPDVWLRQPSMYSTNQTSFQDLVEYNRAVSRSCNKLSGPVFNFMDSISTVKDIDLVRQALGVAKINYLGFSYGTILGQTYAELFPEHVGNFVLDGLADHSEAGSSGLLTESQGTEVTLDQFFAWCNTTTDCALYGTNLPLLFDSVTRTYSSVPVPGQKPASGEEIIYATQDGLLFKDLGSYASWAKYSIALNQTIFGHNATALVNRQEPQNSDFASRAVICQDFGTLVTSPEGLSRIQTVAGALTPHTRGIGLFLHAVAYCISWSAPLRNPPRKLDPQRVSKMPPMLLVNSLYDPESSSRWALAVRDQIPQAVNIFRNGSGHTSYWLYGETSRVMDKFLLSGVLPEDSSVYGS